MIVNQKLSKLYKLNHSIKTQFRLWFKRWYNNHQYRCINYDTLVPPYKEYLLRNRLPLLQGTANTANCFVFFLSLSISLSLSHSLFDSIICAWKKKLKSELMSWYCSDANVSGRHILLIYTKHKILQLKEIMIQI